MRSRIASLSLILLLLCLSCACGTSPSPTSVVQSTPGKRPQQPALLNEAALLAQLHVPPGFHFSIYASGLRTPRFMAIGPDGALLVADPGSNAVIALPPGASPEHADPALVISNKLDSPTSLVMHDGYLYVSESSNIARMPLGNDLKAGPITRIGHRPPTSRPRALWHPYDTDWPG